MTLTPKILTVLGAAVIVVASSICGFSVVHHQMPMLSGAGGTCGGASHLGVLPPLSQAPAIFLVPGIMLLLAAYAVSARFAKNEWQTGPWPGRRFLAAEIGLHSPVFEAMRRGIMHPKLYGASGIF